MAEGSREAVKADDEVVSALRKCASSRSKSVDLQRMLGKKAMENEILCEAVGLAHGKSHLAIAVDCLGRFPVKAIADTLKVSR